MVSIQELLLSRESEKQKLPDEETLKVNEFIYPCLQTFSGPFQNCID